MPAPKHARRPHAVHLLDGNEIEDFIQCPHCGCYFRWTDQMAKKSGWCFECKQLTCGEPACRSCVHFEKKLDLVEQGKMRIEEIY